MSVSPVIAIGLDAADPILLEQWMNDGHLPVLSRLRESGTYTRLANFEYCRAEAACTSFLTGCTSWQTGRWGTFTFDRDSYAVEELQAYEFDEYPPFYTAARGRRVAVFDLPQTRLSPDVDGIQVLGWGAHSAQTARTSVPQDLLRELTSRHGEHPTWDKDHCALWDEQAMAWMKSGLETGIERRAAICRDILRREPWDLFITYFGETHSAGHFFYHLSQPHPMPRSASQHGDWLLEVFQAVDRAVGTIIDAAPPGARFVVFSDHGMEANSTDLPSLVFLPELLYRWSFPGRLGLERGPDRLSPATAPAGKRPWPHEVWALKHDRNPVTRALRHRLPVEFFHYAIERRLGINGVPLCPDDCILGYQPPMWYSPSWPEMKAFALPSFSEGYVRLNVRGRERDGVIEPADYSRVCDEIEGLLGQVRNARTGSPMLRKVLRSRASALDMDPKLPDPDLLVLWTPEPADVVDTPFGRIGPLPFNRSGSHVERGFLLAGGEGIPVAASLADPQAIDLAPTILSLLDVRPPDYMQGKALFTVCAADERPPATDETQSAVAN